MIEVMACEKRNTNSEIVLVVLLHGAMFIQTPTMKMLWCAGRISGRQARIPSFIDIHSHLYLSLHSLMPLGMLFISVFSEYDLMGIF